MTERKTERDRERERLLKALELRKKHKKSNV